MEDQQAMSEAEWPLNLRRTEEQEKADEEWLEKLERGEIKFRKETPKESKRRKRLQALPWTISTETSRKSENFKVTMRCDCGFNKVFDQTASKPWRKHVDDFKETHSKCKRDGSRWRHPRAWRTQ